MLLRRCRHLWCNFITLRTGALHQSHLFLNRITSHEMIRQHNYAAKTGNVISFKTNNGKNMLMWSFTEKNSNKIQLKWVVSACSQGPLWQWNSFQVNHIHYFVQFAIPKSQHCNTGLPRSRVLGRSTPSPRHESLVCEICLHSRALRLLRISECSMFICPALPFRAMQAYSCLSNSSLSSDGAPRRR